MALSATTCSARQTPPLRVVAVIRSHRTWSRSHSPFYRPCTEMSASRGCPSGGCSRPCRARRSFLLLLCLWSRWCRNRCKCLRVPPASTSGRASAATAAMVSREDAQLASRQIQGLPRTRAGRRRCRPSRTRSRKTMAHRGLLGAEAVDPGGRSTAGGPVPLSRRLCCIPRGCRRGSSAKAPPSDIVIIRSRSPPRWLICPRPHTSAILRRRSLPLLRVAPPLAGITPMRAARRARGTHPRRRHSPRRSSTPP
mmetsp:Transcript_11486/g.28948  ORF Transcript_11486/g.28948 Transcript_11486/m.28948 type:complete len:253 (+) Transcript_11486:485-1243(+)